MGKIGLIWPSGWSFYRKKMLFTPKSKEPR